MTAPDMLDLDARIAEAEQRLVRREARLRRRWTALGERVKEAARPQRMLAPAAGLAALLLTLWWLRRPAPAAAAQHRSRDDRPGLPWLRLAGLAWPLLPERWRARVPPALAETAVVFGPWVLGLLGRRRRARFATTAEGPLP